VCFDFFYNSYVYHFSFWEDLRKIWLKMFIGLHVKYPLFLSDFNWSWIFSIDVFKRIQISNFVKILSSGSRVVPCGQTDGHDEANGGFLQLCESAYKLMPCQYFPLFVFVFILKLQALKLKHSQIWIWIQLGKNSYQV